MSSSTAATPSATAAAPVARLARHPTIAPLLSSLNAYYAEDADAPGQPSVVYAELHAAWWPLARAKHRSTPSSASISAGGTADCRVWPAFLEWHIRGDVIDILCHRVFKERLSAINAVADRRTRFARVATLLQMDHYRTILWLGDDVAMKANSLKSLASLLASTAQRRLAPGALLAELYAAALERHRDDLAGPPLVTSADVTVVFRRYRDPAPSRRSSATPSTLAPTPGPSASAATASAPPSTPTLAARKRPAHLVPESEPEPKKRCMKYVGGDRGNEGNEDNEGDEEEEEDVEAGRGVSSHDMSPFRPDLSSFGGESPPFLLSGGQNQNQNQNEDEARARARRLALLQSVVDFEAPVAQAVGAQTAGFWLVFQQFASQLMKAEVEVEDEDDG
ncbi:hypothetical protein F5Y12DRAFT_800706 [Xylaria sp. FL1777]|nr:hypothetical protein F5Y12DRAFT_800706 [Xylaria sp. FL1777]